MPSEPQAGRSQPGLTPAPATCLLQLSGGHKGADGQTKDSCDNES